MVQEKRSVGFTIMDLKRGIGEFKDVYEGGDVKVSLIQ